ncbi:AraC family transcriptional regulator [Sphingomonas koreensis]|jgi:AraC-like DNA-binding protein|uniref:AraC family transcriptional regulator n=1 Tax=Sphingomonas koreensis TaxID=93064 RepID=A0A1L6JB43_9SPHN|nr:helix-turn-helix domain-containing protein [Sphingomonas koreensis]APR53151.1 hypothetical protein BRX40_12605 [Sphingomonas koreensis]RSU24722.1 AraC family transcriptional regulator [Sphingomonas koreensis]RSU24972.1 AraC family transcriptional regulator [Sphingomonas koreensis]RSU27008.1 AraC family transcriptional regulator [Sphingomonas koreensis]RSU32843.1 AraC family transcriptional regulator [Sphingomonas koreensis]
MTNEIPRGTSAQGWSGRLHIGKGFALIDGMVGDNMPHRHFAIQLSTGLNGAIEVVSPEMTAVVGTTVLIASGATHRIGPVGRKLRSLYVEPQSAFGAMLASRLAARAAMRANRDLNRALREWRPGDPILGSDPGATGITTPRTERLLGLIEDGDRDAGPAQWAAALALSPSRLRALSIMAFGVPPIRLRQWGQLKAAARAMAHGASLAQAAAEAGYADQAHFTRQLNRWFGVSPGRGLAGLAIVVDD